MKKLPIHDVLEDITQSLNKHNKLILQASAGAGKSTITPLAFLDTSWLENKMIIMLEPRRLAARMVASRMAQLLDEPLGKTVGYQIKNEKVISPDTKILVVTEAILVRKLQNNQSLDEVGLIIFDEFHERSIHTDLSLALCLQVQELLRDDLKLLIMSATLNTYSLQKLLGKETPVINSSGRVYPIKEIFLKANQKQPSIKVLPTLIYETIINALKEEKGDILVFLSGLKMIRDVEQKLLENKIDASIFLLHSSLGKKEQDSAMRLSNQRKIILSTNIAQTSLTIEGIRIVIDTGLEKQVFYNHDTGMNFLQEQLISKDDATQRAGRAGRLENGICYKLWHQSKILNDHALPEILRTDISNLVLETALWGENIKQLAFLDRPSEEKVNQAKALLQALQMLDESEQITSWGKAALHLGVHPRLAFMIFKSNELGFAWEACLLASLLSSDDILKHHNSVNLYDRFLALSENRYMKNSKEYTKKEVIKGAKSLFERLKKNQTITKSQKELTASTLGLLCLFAYPDRLAQQRKQNENRYKLSNAKGAVLNEQDELFNEPFLVIPNLHAHNKDSYIQQALPILRADIQSHFDFMIEPKEVLKFNAKEAKFEFKKESYFLKLLFTSQALPLNEVKDLSKAIVQLVLEEGLEILQFDAKVKLLLQRIALLCEHESIFPCIDEDYLINHLHKWFSPYLQSIHNFQDVLQLDFYNQILALLSYEEQQKLDSMAPLKIKVPSGSMIRIDYSEAQPILKVQLQEVFGWQETPKIMNNQMALQLHLLSPAKRPIQITYDLKSFWENAYAEVRKELQGKYKKHYWPQDPFEAIATNKTKRQMKLT